MARTAVPPSRVLVIERSNPAWADIPVVLITAVYDVARSQQETGAKAVITKPFDIDQLVDVVNSHAA